MVPMTASTRYFYSRSATPPFCVLGGVWHIIAKVMPMILLLLRLPMIFAWWVYAFGALVQKVFYLRGAFGFFGRLSEPWSFGSIARLDEPLTFGFRTI